MNRAQRRALHLAFYSSPMKYAQGFDEGWCHDKVRRLAQKNEFVVGGTILYPTSIKLASSIHQTTPALPVLILHPIKIERSWYQLWGDRLTVRETENIVCTAERTGYGNQSNTRQDKIVCVL